MATESLADFLQRLRLRNAAESMYGPVGVGILGSDVTRSDAGAGRNFGANLAKALLGGLAIRLGRQEQEDYSTNLNTTAREVLAGRDVSPSEYIDNQTIADLRAFKLNRDLERADQLDDLRMDVFKAGLITGAQEEAKLNAYQKNLFNVFGSAPAVKEEGEVIGADAIPGGVASLPDGSVKLESGGTKKPSVVTVGAASPNIDALEAISEVNPLAKGIVQSERRKEDKARDTRNDQDALLKGARDYLKQVGADYGTARSNFQLLVDNYDKSDKAADLTYAIAVNKILDPSSVVREGEVENVKQLVPYLQRYITGINNWITPEGTIKPEGKAALLRAVAPKLKAIGTQYGGLYDTEMKRVQTLGGDPSLVAATKYEPFDLDTLVPPQTKQIGGVTYVKTDGGWTKR